MGMLTRVASLFGRIFAAFTALEKLSTFSAAGTSLARELAAVHSPDVCRAKRTASNLGTCSVCDALRVWREVVADTRL